MSANYHLDNIEECARLCAHIDVQKAHGNFTEQDSRTYVAIRESLRKSRAAIAELIAAATASRAARKAFEAGECIGLLDAVRCADAKLDAALAAVGGEGQG